MKFPGPSDPECLLWHDYERLDASGTLWFDSGRRGLHATPQAGFATPAWGLARNERGNGYCDYTGVANRYATIPVRFYDSAPTYGWTVVLVAQHTTPVIGNVVFSAVNAGATRGISLTYSTTERLVMTAYDAAGVVSTLVDAADAPLVGRTRVSVYAMDKALSTGYIWHDGVGRTATFAGNANQIGYDVATVPALGATPAGASRFLGLQYDLILYSGWIPSNSEAEALCRYWRDRT